MTGSQLKAAFRRRRIAVLLVFILAVGAFVALGLQRQPTWKAESRLNVGAGDITSQSIPGYAVGIQSLAASFSRAIVANEVTGAVAGTLGVPRKDIENQLSASPVSGSSLILVEATGSSERQAIDIANEGARRLIAFVVERTDQQGRSDRLLAEFKKAAASLLRAEARRSALERAEASPGKVAEAGADVSRYKLESETLSARYQASVEQDQPGKLVRVLTEASFATSDRKAAMQKLGLTGVAVGIVLGLVVMLVPLRRRKS